jgi:phenylacetate-CoA ligase
LEAYQAEQLQRLVSHAYANVPYYRERMDELGLRPEDIRGPADLPRLPLLTKDDIRAHTDSLLARNVSRDRLRYVTTGGSTGTPLGLWHDRYTADPHEDAFRLRQWNWAGYRFGDRVVNVQGNLILTDDGQLMWDYNTHSNELVLPVRHMSEEAMPGYVRLLRQFAPRFAAGYPSSLELLARYLKRKDIRDIRLEAVFLESETLYPQQRQLIEEQFGAPVFAGYGQTERVADAVECEHHRGYHVSMEYGVLELVDKDGEPITRPGVLGRVVGTGFDSYGMPLIRYATDDLATLAEGECPCGRQLTLVQDFHGRLREFIVTRSGQLVPVPVLFAGHGEIWAKLREVKFVQEEPGVLAVHAAPAPEFTEEEVRAGLRELVDERLGGDVAVTVHIVDSVPRTLRGKVGLMEQRLPISLADLETVAAGGGIDRARDGS